MSSNNILLLIIGIAFISLLSNKDNISNPVGIDTFFNVNKCPNTF